MLYKIFPECDPACKNIDRLFFGGKELIYLDEDAQFPSFCIIQGSELHQSIRRRQEKRKLGVKETSNCQLLNDFNSGAELSHNERFLILTNLLQISGGEKAFF